MVKFQLAHFKTLMMFLLFLCSLVPWSLAATFSGIKFCDEKYFDNMFQDKQYIYLNIYDANHNENRLYRWVYGSSEIDQFVTMNVDAAFPIPQTGFFSNRFDGLTVSTFYQLRESGNDFVTICARYGADKRIRYNSTNPYPIFPVCNCTKMKANAIHYFCDHLNELSVGYFAKQAFKSILLATKVEPVDNSLSNKYLSMYYQDRNATLKTYSRVYAFKRYDRREVIIFDDFFDDEGIQSIERDNIFRYPIEYEVVGMVAVKPDHVNESVVYLLEEVAISKIGYIAQYMWEVNVWNPNFTLVLKNRVHWRDFFGCHSSSALSLATTFGILLFTIFVEVAVILSVMYFYFDYDLLLMKAKQTTLSYYLS